MLGFNLTLRMPPGEAGSDRFTCWFTPKFVAKIVEGMLKRDDRRAPPEETGDQRRAIIGDRSGIKRAGAGRESRLHAGIRSDSLGFRVPGAFEDGWIGGLRRHSDFRNEEWQSRESVAVCLKIWQPLSQVCSNLIAARV